VIKSTRVLVSSKPAQAEPVEEQKGNNGPAAEEKPVVEEAPKEIKKKKIDRKIV
jgi:hypothetical protein